MDWRANALDNANITELRDRRIRVRRRLAWARSRKNHGRSIQHPALVYVQYSKFAAAQIRRGPCIRLATLSGTRLGWEVDERSTS